MIRPLTLFALVLVAALTFGLPADKDNGLMRIVKRQAFYGQYCNNQGCNICNGGQCAQTCSGPQCSACPNGNCCNGQNCNACSGNECCANQQCNSCVNNCAAGCQVQQPQVATCPQTCAQNCVQQQIQPYVLPQAPAPQPVIVPISSPPQPCNSQSPTEPCQMTETTITQKNHTMNGKLENAVNVSTIIHLNNLINNTNVITNPVHVNSTNINNIHIAGYKYNDQHQPDQPIINNPATFVQQNSSQKCCTVIAPQQCQPTHQPPYRRCYRRRYRECSPVCQQGFPQVAPQPIPMPQYIPQPLPLAQVMPQQPCQILPQYPYIQCPNQNAGYGQNCGQCYTGCPPNVAPSYCDNQRQFCTSTCGFSPIVQTIQPTVVAPAVTIQEASVTTVDTEDNDDDDDDCGDDC